MSQSPDKHPSSTSGASSSHSQNNPDITQQCSNYIRPAGAPITNSPASHSISQSHYHTIPRPWGTLPNPSSSNIRQHKQSTRLTSPMAQWLNESVKDSPWNSVERVVAPANGSAGQRKGDQIAGNRGGDAWSTVTNDGNSEWRR